MRTRFPILVTVAGLLAAAPTAHATGLPLAAGELTGAGGAPSAGTVRAFAFTPGSGSMAPLATARADRRGRFALAGGRAAALADLARENGGWATVMVEARTASGTTTEFFSRRVAVTPLAPVAARITARVPRLRLRTTGPLGPPPPPAGAARTARGCHLGTTTKKVLRRRNLLTTVGELNNAYKDTSVSFTYGRQADSSVSSSISYGAAGFHIHGSVEIANTQSRAAGSAIGTGNVKGHFSRQMKTYFTYTSYKVYDCGLNGPSHIRYVVIPTRWYGGLHYASLRGGLHRCPHDGPHAYLGGQTFDTSNEQAHTWSRTTSFGFSYRGFSASVGVDARSGYSQYVRVHMHFGGPRTRRHYICGENGGSPLYAARLFSGAG